MRPAYFVALTLLGWALPLRASGLRGTNIDILRRQDTAAESFPTLTTDTPSSSIDQAASETSTPTGDSTTSTENPKSSGPGAADETTSPKTTPTPSKGTTTTTFDVPTASPPNAYHTATALGETHPDQLPLKPKITPAFGTAGVLLIILGSGYALVGVKNRWVQVFLSSGFLASIATTALVVYVMDPPVRDAIQGGYLVAIVMAGVIFGAGALIFKDFTEGLGCLLGGFCLSMWLLTLRHGGLVRSSGGKGVFIGVFCLVPWALSWTHYTRPYGLIVSTSFAGATAFMLGIDCLTKAGMKEFWIYLWDINDNLFPLNTTTYPQTRGIRVEIAIVIIGTIIGLLSQIKLWKVIRSKQREREMLDREDGLQNDAIEAALGRHLERQNEREKSEWERHYGDRHQGKGNTILWQDAHPDKQYSQVSVVTVAPVSPSPSPSPSASLEMDVSGRKRPSSVTVDVIEEVEEKTEQDALKGRPKSLETLEECVELCSEQRQSGESSTDVKAMSDSGRDQQVSVHTAKSEEVDERPPSRRRSQATPSALTQRLSPTHGVASESREHLLGPERPVSRASSAAATLDTDNEALNVNVLGSDTDEGGNGRRLSQGSEGAGSSVETLTQTALAQVPSQLSNVVLSYRTNEWAKHIAAADVPVFDEPETISGVEDELATRLAPSTAATEHILLSRDPNVKVVPAGSAIHRVKAGGTGVGIVPGPGLSLTAKRRSLPEQARRSGRPQVSSRSGSMQLQSLRTPGNRSSRKMFNPDWTGSLVTTPIDENTPTVFPHPRSSSRRASEGTPYMTPSQRRFSAPLPRSSGIRPYTDTPHDGVGAASPYGGETRLDSYHSRQPARRDGRSDLDRRQSLLAEWRLSQQDRATSNGLGGASAEAGWAQMRADKENQKVVGEYQRAAQREKQYAMDQAMRRPEMQGLHREALRKMQASATRKL
ncbi:hypothetical protein A1O3_01249 [Capronia epimyces CBS 606.96]|uniref:TM7S3/TM198-like domain-containing protein n=1 Tax=Capronia epimyces CBS 606.96 TaxID=1182542 RepID=W9YIH7_9EURO|nr:uncharacterized protein A1O3_01249 [Capronia epimyces CBS 606.96]EXJ92697.1 hypothetical protein A1O3_01249 [Capronia epimyces CBS 606.96]